MTDLFVAEDTGTALRSLRRFTAYEKHDDCPLPENYGHNAVNALDAIPTPPELVNENGLPFNGSGSTLAGSWPRDDPRWPSACACGYVFTADDEWQYNLDRLFRAPDGSTFTIRDAPVGAMIRHPWYDHFGNGTESWWIELPQDGAWVTSQYATGGGEWTVEGEPPNITVTPSIFCSPPTGWHGWIRNGKLLNA